MAKRSKIIIHCEELLTAQQFQDFCKNIKASIESNVVILANNIRNDYDGDNGGLI